MIYITYLQNVCMKVKLKVIDIVELQILGNITLHNK